MPRIFKTCFIVLLFFSNLFALNDKEILSAKIPPSAYLEILAEKSEKKSRRGAKFGSYFFAGWGLLFYQASNFKDNSEFPGPGFGYAMGSICLGLGAGSRIRLLSDKPISKTKRLYEEIQRYGDVNIREKAAYDLLVLLAESSRMTRNSTGNPPETLESALILGALKSIKTIEEKALRGFLEQTPVQNVF